ncbi:MAG: hypothetical protein J3Q66DRAFT_419016 [Benniella sp.]|nr:MAG: hypothetical protein J3Q66DRAFT_419016 [Benniella sp.]
MPSRPFTPRSCPPAYQTGEYIRNLVLKTVPELDWPIRHHPPALDQNGYAGSLRMLASPWWFNCLARVTTTPTHAVIYSEALKQTLARPACFSTLACSHVEALLIDLRAVDPPFCQTETRTWPGIPATAFSPANSAGDMEQPRRRRLKKKLSYATENKTTSKMPYNKTLTKDIDLPLVQTVHKIRKRSGTIAEEAAIQTPIKAQSEDSFKACHQEATQNTFPRLHNVFQSGINDLALTRSQDHCAITALTSDLQKIVMTAQSDPISGGPQDLIPIHRHSATNVFQNSERRKIIPANFGCRLKQYASTNQQQYVDRSVDRK